MNISDFSNSFSSLDSLNSLKLPEFISNLTTPSAQMFSNLSSLSTNQIFLIFGGLMLFRFFFGIFFSIFGLFGIVSSTVISIICALAAIPVRIFGTIMLSFLNLLGSIGTYVFNSPLQFISMLLTRWGRILIPVVASGIMSSLYLQSDSLISHIIPSIKSHFVAEKEWVAIDQNSQNELMEKF